MRDPRVARMISPSPTGRATTSSPARKPAARITSTGSVTWFLEETRAMAFTLPCSRVKVGMNRTVQPVRRAFLRSPPLPHPGQPGLSGDALHGVLELHAPRGRPGCEDERSQAVREPRPVKARDRVGRPDLAAHRRAELLQRP